jgi:hypothetical protein
MRRKKGKRKGKYDKKKKIKKEKGGNFGHFTLYTAGRSCFAKRFPKTVSHSTTNLLTSTPIAEATTAAAPAVANGPSLYNMSL